MASIWFVSGTAQDGKSIQRDWPDCKRLLELDEFSRTEARPQFGEVDTVPFYSHAVVELRSVEAVIHGAMPGWFVSPLSVEDVQARLGFG